MGGITGAVGGAALSPNSESRGLNALVFGLAGALIGGLIGFFSGTPSKREENGATLESREKATNGSREIQAPTGADLPAFVKERFRPAVIEEYTEQDSISEDGSLSEPHKVYRIKRPAELVTKPVVEGEKP
jgi:hypothetical protein